MKYRALTLILALAGCDSGTSAVSSAPAPNDPVSDDSVTSAIVSAPVPVQADAAAPADSISVGNPAPDFELPGSDGQTHRLADYAGQHVVLAFFPKAFTGG